RMCQCPGFIPRKHWHVCCSAAVSVPEPLAGALLPCPLRFAHAFVTRPLVLEHAFPVIRGSITHARAVAHAVMNPLTFAQALHLALVEFALLLLILAALALGSIASHVA